MKPDRLRILQVIPSLDTGGAEGVTIDLARAVVRSGGRAVVATSGGRLVDDLIHVGGDAEIMPVQAKDPITIAANAGRLARLAHQQDLGLIHAHSRAPGWSALWAARASRRPFVASYHGVYVARNAVKRWYNSVMARADAVIATSQYTRAHVIAEHRLKDPDRVVVIPPGVDINAFDRTKVTAERIEAKRNSWGLAPDDERAIIVVPARLSRIKGQQTVIEAAAMVEAAMPGRTLYILAGDAQGREQYLVDLDTQAIALGVKSIVRRVGHVRDMPAALAAATIGVFPSLVPESFGKAAVEAQAIGLPVVAANLGGQAETVREGETGLLFPAGDAAALAAAIQRILTMTPGERDAMTAAGQERARALYSSAAMQSATLELYGRLIEAGPRGVLGS